MDIKTQPTSQYGFRIAPYSQESTHFWSEYGTWKEIDRTQNAYLRGVIHAGPPFREPIRKDGYALLPADFEGKPEAGDWYLSKFGMEVPVQGQDGPFKRSIKDMIAEDGDLAWLRPIKKEEEVLKESLTTQPTLEESRLKALEWMDRAGKALFDANPSAPYTDFVAAIGCYAGIELEIAKKSASGTDPVVNDFWRTQLALEMESTQEIIEVCEGIREDRENANAVRLADALSDFFKAYRARLALHQSSLEFAPDARPIPAEKAAEVWPCNAPKIEGWEFYCFANPVIKRRSHLHALGSGDPPCVDPMPFDDYPSQAQSVYRAARGPLYRRIEGEPK